MESTLNNCKPLVKGIEKSSTFVNEFRDKGTFFANLLFTIQKYHCDCVLESQKNNMGFFCLFVFYCWKSGQVFFLYHGVISPSCGI